jgi:hypothetical protein
MAQFLSRSNWPLFRPAAGLNPEPSNQKRKQNENKKFIDISPGRDDDGQPYNCGFGQVA